LAELRLDDQEKELLLSVRDFSISFEEYTQLVSVSGSSLSLVVLIHKDIKKKTRATAPSNSALDELKCKIEQNINK